MTERNWEGEFWDAVVSIAADDETLTRSLGCLLMGIETLGEPELDYEDLEEYIYHRYDMPPERIEEVFDVCEARINGQEYGVEA